VVGARKFLIAYNINLATADVEVARRIARAVRCSSGGLPCVKAMGVPLASRGLAQVSMNLTDFEQTPVHRVFEAVRAEAARCGTAIAGSEIIGLIPKQAIEMTAEWALQIEGFRPELVLENRLAAAVAAESPETAAILARLVESLESLAASSPSAESAAALALAREALTSARRS
jgi:glutamate formiminotransferase